MSDPVRFLNAFAQSLGVMTLYPEGHPSRERAVDAAYDAGMSAGGKDEGAPGLREHYHPNYYGAYLRDPDGNKVCVVCHKPA